METIPSARLDHKEACKKLHGSLKSPACRCVSITLPASSRTDPEKFKAFLSPCCLKEKRERHCHPTARAPFLDCIKESDRFLVPAR
jgi:hypothetical protein